MRCDVQRRSDVVRQNNNDRESPQSWKSERKGNRERERGGGGTDVIRMTGSMIPPSRDSRPFWTYLNFVRPPHQLLLLVLTLVLADDRTVERAGDV